MAEVSNTKNACEFFIASSLSNLSHLKYGILCCQNISGTVTVFLLHNCVINLTYMLLLIYGLALSPPQILYFSVFDLSYCFYGLAFFQITLYLVSLVFLFILLVLSGIAVFSIT